MPSPTPRKSFPGAGDAITPTYNYLFMFVFIFFFKNINIYIYIYVHILTRDIFHISQVFFQMVKISKLQ
jgi:hypothetical protein